MSFMRVRRKYQTLFLCRLQPGGFFIRFFDMAKYSCKKTAIFIVPEGQTGFYLRERVKHSQKDDRVSFFAVVCQKKTGRTGTCVQPVSFDVI